MCISPQLVCMLQTHGPAETVSQVYLPCPAEYHSRATLFDRLSHVQALEIDGTLPLPLFGTAQLMANQVGGVDRALHHLEKALDKVRPSFMPCLPSTAECIYKMRPYIWQLRAFPFWKI